MIAELADGTVVSGTAVGSEVAVKEAQVAVTLERINQYLGTALDEATVTFNIAKWRNSCWKSNQSTTCYAPIKELTGRSWYE